MNKPIGVRGGLGAPWQQLPAAAGEVLQEPPLRTFTLLDTLELEATSADHSVLDPVELLRAIRAAPGEYVPEKVKVGHGPDAVTVAIDVDLGTKAWRKILVVKDRPGKLVRRHLEVWVFSYRAFRELGRVIRTITLLRFLADARPREQITAITNKAEASHGFSAWAALRWRGDRAQRPGLSGEDHQVQRAAGELRDLLQRLRHHRRGERAGLRRAPDRHRRSGHDYPYITHTIRRFGDPVLDLSPPDAVPVTTLDLVPGALFPGDITPAAAPVATAPRRTRQGATSKKGS